VIEAIRKGPPSPGAAVREARPAEFDAIARCIGRAFHDDPIASYFFPDEATRSRRFAVFSKFVMRLLSSHGLVMTTDPVGGAAIWQAPSPPRPTRLQTIYSIAAMAACTRSAFFRAAGLGELTAKSHPAEPHWYLAIIGTEPVSQRRGIGSELISATLRSCDETHSPAYLESSKEANIPFYERHGFRVTEEINVPGRPRLWPMYRAPR
jgi:ribosomal protein S18 acetylase RimI-like enzyme